MHSLAPLGPVSRVTIDRITLRQVDLPPKVLRTDAIQSFVTQETILVTLHTSDGLASTGYAYTIGTGGSSVVALLKDHLLPRLILGAAELPGVKVNVRSGFWPAWQASQHAEFRGTISGGETAWAMEIARGLGLNLVK